ncbi:50S ribosomal protein L19 [Candidatus Peregrinibacteria bacterium]|nr:50S ribosomal protein L19 [Candidatus Peregrinibacteria bacterium]
MSILKEIQELSIKKKMPVLRPGYTVRIHQKIKEGEKDRIQIFEGLIIKINAGHGGDKTFTVRKIVEGVGVEKIFPLYSPLIEKIDVKKEGNIRRAKLYYMRGRAGKSARLKENFVSEEEMETAVNEAVAVQKDKEETAVTEAKQE